LKQPNEKTTGEKAFNLNLCVKKLLYGLFLYLFADNFVKGLRQRKKKRNFVKVFLNSFVEERPKKSK
jgi:hypothetical protein